MVTRPAVSLALIGKFAGQDRRSHHYATPPTNVVLVLVAVEVPVVVGFSKY